MTVLDIVDGDPPRDHRFGIFGSLIFLVGIRPDDRCEREPIVAACMSYFVHGGPLVPPREALPKGEPRWDIAALTIRDTFDIASHAGSAPIATGHKIRAELEVAFARPR